MVYIDHHGSENEVPIDGVPLPSPSCFHLEPATVLLAVRVDLVPGGWETIFTEEDWAVNILIAALSAFDFKAYANEVAPKHLKNLIASEAVIPVRGSVDGFTVCLKDTGYFGNKARWRFGTKESCEPDQCSAPRLDAKAT